MFGIVGQFSPEGIPNREPTFFQEQRKEPSPQASQFMDRCCMITEVSSRIATGNLGPTVLVFHGELYNTQELKKELPGTDRNTSAEIVLNAFHRWGNRCFDRLRGCFAVAIYETDQGRITLARDHFGLKPLFYAIRNNTLYFASELSSLLRFPEIDPVITPEGIQELMFMGPGRTPGCGVFQGVHELLPGEYAVYNRSGLVRKAYWTLKDRENHDTMAEAIEKTRFLVEDSIAHQLYGNTSIGAFLSGGLDSSIVSSVAARHMGTLNTYSLDYQNNKEHFTATRFQPTSDDSYMEQMAKHIGARAHRVTLQTEELISSLNEAATARGLPGMADVDSSMLLLCREAHKTSDVVLSGECADEIFGGYPWFRDPEIRATVGFPWAQNTAYRASFLTDDLRNHLDPEGYVQSRYQEAIASADILPNTSPIEKRMKEMMVLNLYYFMQTLLARNDCMSKCSGLTVRVPFCNKEIVEYLYTVPWEHKELGGMEKGLLREAFKELLPKEVLHRKKSPFPKTWDPMYKDAVSDLLRQELEGTNSPLLSFLKKDRLLELCEEDRSLPWYGQLMTTPQTIAYFLQMAHWLRFYHVSIR